MTSAFGKAADKPLFMATGKVYNKVVKTAGGNEKWTMEVFLLPMQQLSEKVRDIEILLGLETILLSVGKLLDE